jgi:hypothetical protein
MFTPNGLKAVSEIWGSLEYKDREDHHDGEKLIEQMLKRLHAEGLRSAMAVPKSWRSARSASACSADRASDPPSSSSLCNALPLIRTFPRVAYDLSRQIHPADRQSEKAACVRAAPPGTSRNSLASGVRDRTSIEPLRGLKTCQPT